MHKADIKKDYLKKIKRLNDNNKYYYEKSKPKISDADFDQLKVEIIELENKNISFFEIEFSDENNNVLKIPEKDLPVKLPEDIDINANGNPLDANENWKNIIINGKNVKEKQILLIPLLTHLGII